MAHMKDKIEGYRKNRKGFRIGDEWYNFEEKVLDKSYNPGAEVEFDYESKPWKGKVWHIIDDSSFVAHTKGKAWSGNRGGGGKGGKFDPDGQARGNAIHAASRVVAASIVAGKLDTKHAVPAIEKIAKGILDAFAEKPEAKPAPQQAPQQDVPEEAVNDPFDGDNMPF